MNDILSRIDAMKYKDIENNDLGKAAVVTLTQSKKCFKCNRLMHKGTKAILASHMVDPRYNISYKYLLNNDFVDSSHFNFVPVNHWICMDCASDIVGKYHEKRNKLLVKLNLKDRKAVVS